MTKMFIPKRIKIGFQQRPDTFTGKLSYIIYYDEKGKLRKEASWNSWRDDNIQVLEFDNVPQNGYIFNKGIQRDGYWGSGRSVIRVYDPRDFEFEISVDNLMGILMHSDVSKRDIVEQCVFAWEGTELVLLPVNSKEYQESVEYTKKQDQKITSKELVPGYIYQAKKLDTPLIYIGQREWFDWGTGYEKNGQMTKKYNYYDRATYVTYHESKGKKHVFYDGTQFITKTPADLSAVLVDFVDENYAHIVDLFFSGYHSQKIVSVSLTDDIKRDTSIYHYYDNYFYFATKDYLVSVNLDTENSYKNNDYSYRPRVRHTVSSLFYPSSIQIRSDNVNPSIVEFQKIIQQFNSEFSEYVSRDKLEETNKLAREWLIKNGIKQGYNVVLENGKEVLKSYH